MKSILKYSFFILCCVFLINLSCEDIDFESEAAGNVQGLWQFNQNSTGNNTFLLISDTEVNYYHYNSRENCITIDAYEVIRIDGDGFYILKQEGLEGNKVLAISKNGVRIDVRDIDDTQSNIVKYWASEVDINALAPVCINPTDVFGEWELVIEEKTSIYLSITQDSIKVFDLFSEQKCYVSSKLEILEINGNVFTISDNTPGANSSTQEVTITRISEGIEVERFEEGVMIKEIYTESETDFSTFEPTCDFGPLEFLEGIWKFEDPGVDNSPEFYMTLRLDFMSFHFLIGDPVNDPDNVCFEVEQFEIVTIDEQSFSVRGIAAPFEELTYTIEYNESEGLLYLDDTFDNIAFFRTDIDDDYINNQCSETLAN